MLVLNKIKRSYFFITENSMYHKQITLYLNIRCKVRIFIYVLNRRLIVFSLSTEMIGQVKESITTSSLYQYFRHYISQVMTFVNSILKRSLKENLEQAFTWIENIIHRSVLFFLNEGIYVYE